MAHIAFPLGNEFYFQLVQPLDLGSPKQRFENNKQVIQLAKELASSGGTASLEELALLSKYVGWGDSRLASHVHELEGLLAEDELRSARFDPRCPLHRPACNRRHMGSRPATWIRRASVPCARHGRRNWSLQIHDTYKESVNQIWPPVNSMVLNSQLYDDCDEINYQNLSRR
jgi:hypothetical protein